MSRPLLFVDVDGVLNALGPRRPLHLTRHELKPDLWVERHAPLPEEEVPALTVFLNPVHGPALLALRYELVWATTWEHSANTWISPLMGLPELPVVEFNEDPALEVGAGLSLKTRTIVAFAAGRPFAWIDDDILGDDIAWVAENHPGPALLHPVDAEAGLTDADLTSLSDWARYLAEEAS